MCLLLVVGNELDAVLRMMPIPDELAILNRWHNGGVEPCKSVESFGEGIKI